MPSDKRARQRAFKELKLAEQQRRQQRSKRIRRVVGAIAVIGLVIGIVAALSSSSNPKPAKKPKPAVTTTTSVNKAEAPLCPPATPAGASKRVISFTKPPPMCIAKTAVFDATVKTDAGSFVIRMQTASSPAAVNNFVFLARYHFFDSSAFHRVIPGFVVQGGAPTGTSTGPGYSFTGNLPPASCAAASSCYPTWTVAMANSSNPTSNQSQFFIVLPGGESVLSRNYTAFGRVVSGTKVVAAIGADGATSGTPKKLHHMITVTVTQVG